MMESAQIQLQSLLVRDHGKNKLPHLCLLLSLNLYSVQLLLSLLWCHLHKQVKTSCLPTLAFLLMNIFYCECPLLSFPFCFIDFQLLCRKLHHMWHLSSVCSLPHLHSAAMHRMWPAVSLPFRTVHTHQDPCNFLKSHKTAQVSTEQFKMLREHVCVEDFVKQICMSLFFSLAHHCQHGSVNTALQ